jgi:hypothetical protein
MPGSFVITRIRGIEIRLHFTFLLVLPVLAVAFARNFVRTQQLAFEEGASPGAMGGSPLVLLRAL